LDRGNDVPVETVGFQDGSDLAFQADHLVLDALKKIESGQRIYSGLRCRRLFSYYVVSGALRQLFNVRRGRRGLPHSALARGGRRLARSHDVRFLSGLHVLVRTAAGLLPPAAVRFCASDSVVSAWCHQSPETRLYSFGSLALSILSRTQGAPP